MKKMVKDRDTSLLGLLLIFFNVCPLGDDNLIIVLVRSRSSGWVLSAPCGWQLPKMGVPSTDAAHGNFHGLYFVIYNHVSSFNINVNLLGD